MTWAESIHDTSSFRQFDETKRMIHDEKPESCSYRLQFVGLQIPAQKTVGIKCCCLTTLVLSQSLKLVSSVPLIDFALVSKSLKELSSVPQPSFFLIILINLVLDDVDNQM